MSIPDTASQTPTNDQMGTLREYLCKLEPMRIPRPKCSGMEFVQTKGRQGFYLSLRRKEQKNQHTPLSAITFAPPIPTMTTGGQQPTNGHHGQHQHTNFEHRLNEATSGLSLGNGQQKNPNNTRHHSMTKLSA